MFTDRSTSSKMGTVVAGEAALQHNEALHIKKTKKQNFCSHSKCAARARKLDEQDLQFEKDKHPARVTCKKYEKKKKS